MMKSFCKQKRRPRATTTNRRGWSSPTSPLPITGQPTKPRPGNPNCSPRVTNTQPNDLRGLNLRQSVHQERTHITNTAYGESAKMPSRTMPPRGSDTDQRRHRPSIRKGADQVFTRRSQMGSVAAKTLEDRSVRGPVGGHSWL
jgi:hypothetical protein